MALVICPECGKEKVSDSAVSCPDCGFPIKEHFEKLYAQQQAKEKQKAENKQRIENESESEEQRKSIERIENLIRHHKKDIWKYAIMSAVFVPLTVVSWNLSLGIAIVIAGFFAFGSVVCLIGTINDLNTANNDLELAKEDFKKYDKIYLDRIKVANAQLRKSQSEYSIKHPKCPMCGSTNTERISTANRAVSVAAVGLASSKIGKQYQCKKCKHKW